MIDVIVDAVRVDHHRFVSPPPSSLLPSLVVVVVVSSFVVSVLYVFYNVVDAILKQFVPM